VSGASPAIITKVLLPSKRPALIHRPRLVDFIHDNINRKLIIVSAGAGYGKTSLLVTTQPAYHTSADLSK